MYADPEAAYVVFEAWPQLTMVSWETTVAHGFPPELVAKWMSWDTIHARFFQKITANTLTYLKEKFGSSMLYGADGLALAVVLEPDIVQESAQHYVSVECNGRFTRGQTIVDWNDRTGQRANANIILKVNYDRFVALMEMWLR